MPPQQYYTFKLLAFGKESSRLGKEKEGETYADDGPALDVGILLLEGVEVAGDLGDSLAEAVLAEPGAELMLLVVVGGRVPVEMLVPARLLGE